MKSCREAALLVTPSVRRRIERIAEETGAPLRTIIDRALRRYLQDFEDLRKERAFRRIASAKARAMGIETLDDADKLVHSVRS